MQRFDINNSDWAALFRSKDGGSELFQSLVDNTDLLNMDEGWMRKPCESQDLRPYPPIRQGCC